MSQDIRITRAGQDTTLGRVRELILAAEKTKLPLARLMDEYMGCPLKSIQVSDN